jgi:hypothetical protein
MTPIRTSTRLAVTRFGPDTHHPRLYALLMLVVTALVVTLGTRFTAPDATAATTDKTFETDDHVVTQAQDGTITVVDKRTQIAVQDTVDPATAGLTDKELAAQADGLSHQLKNNLGWDLTIDADRTRLLNETRAFAQQLHNIPQTTLDLEENAGLRAVRDIVDEMDGTKTCRDRCLIADTARTMIMGVGLAHSLRILKSLLAEGGQPQVARAVALSTLVTGQLLAFWYMLERDLNNMPVAFTWMVRLMMTALLREVHQAFDDVVDYVAHSRTTMRQAVTDAAQNIDTLTPDDEPATDYDLAKDEL